MPDAAELDAAVAAELARRRRAGQDPDATQMYVRRSDRESSARFREHGDGRMWAVVVLGPRCSPGSCCSSDGRVFTLEDLPELPRHDGCDCRYVAAREPGELARERAAAPGRPAAP